MNKTINHGNGNGETTGVRFTSQVIEENPYLQRRPGSPSAQPCADEDAFDQSAEDEAGPPIELEDGRRKLKQRRRRLAMVGVASLLLITMVGAMVLYSRIATRVEYGPTTKQHQVLSPAPNVKTTTGRDSRTEQAIEEAQRLTARNSETYGTTGDKLADATSPAANYGLSHDSPFKTPTGFTGTFNATTDGTEKRTNAQSIQDIERGSASTPSNGAASTSDVSNTRSLRSSESSLYMNEPSTELRVDVGGRAETNKPLVPNSKPNPVMLPAFGSMLPVRTVGALYTLRSGALVRFELTRETKGNGWSLKGGTILVGTSRGGDYDRAYVTVMGFIDPHSGKLVKLGGEVRGGDGGAGLKGKRKQIDGGWARALGLLSKSALDVTGALLSGGDTVVISDGLRTRTINPVTDEISGVLGTELDRRQSRSFVEVLAGTPGYVMVTDLPGVIKGTDATPELDNESLASLTDVDSARPATGLTERELADLLATGSPEQILAAMPRMSIEMRKVAAAVLHQ